MCSLGSRGDLSREEGSDALSFSCFVSCSVPWCDPDRAGGPRRTTVARRPRAILVRQSLDLMNDDEIPKVCFGHCPTFLAMFNGFLILLAARLFLTFDRIISILVILRLASVGLSRANASFDARAGSFSWFDC